MRNFANFAKIFQHFTLKKQQKKTFKKKNKNKNMDMGFQPFIVSQTWECYSHRLCHNGIIIGITILIIVIIVSNTTVIILFQQINNHKKQNKNISIVFFLFDRQITQTHRKNRTHKSQKNNKIK